jgi:hypothetical protein
MQRMELNDVISPFEVVDSLDGTIALARQAFADHVARTPATEARSSDVETYFVDVLSNLWAAREAMCASIEAENG